MNASADSSPPTDARAAIAAMMRSESAVVLGYLFGSRAKGRQAENSDFDVAVLLREDVAAEWAFRARFEHSLAKTLGTARVDLVVLNRAPPELAYAVVARGALLYECDRASRVEFEAKTMARYGDYLPFLRAQKKEILAGSDYGTRVQRYRAALGRTLRTIGEIAGAGGKVAS